MITTARICHTDTGLAFVLPRSENIGVVRLGRKRVFCRYFRTGLPLLLSLQLEGKEETEIRLV